MSEAKGRTSEPYVIFVDDDGDAASSLIRAVKSLGLSARADAFTTAAAALAAIAKKKAVDVVVLDLSLDDRRGVESGFSTLSEIIKISPDTRIIVLTGHGTDEYGIKALQLGAASFVVKPAEPAHLTALIADGIAQSQLRRRVRELEASDKSRVTQQLIGSSSAMVKLRNELEFLSTNSISVFLRGETGVGKSYFAMCLHQLALERGTRGGNFTSYAPRAGSSDLISSDLFGHVKGAFTGATEAKSGLLKHAENGTLFLDEVDELPTEVQVTLLTVLQNRTFRPVGSTDALPFTGRIISASNGDHEESQRSGKLRQDFFHRLAQEIITIPPLRERSDDVPQLASAFLQSINTREGITISGFEASALQALTDYAWPGNVRELEKAVERAAMRANYDRQTLVSIEHLPASVLPASGLPASGLWSSGLPTSALGEHPPKSSSNVSSFSEQVEAYKIKLIETALERASGNQMKAAEILSLDRSSMRRILGRRK